FLKATGVGDVAYFGPEPEFFILDDVRFDTNQHESFYHVDSVEGRWNSGRVEGPNLAYKPRYKEGYFPVQPTDSQQDIRQEMVMTMERVGIRVEKQHHEVATAGQAEIDMRFLSLVKMADALQWYKHIVKNVAKKHGKTATFMPKPVLLAVAEGQAHRGPLPRSELQRLPRLLGDVDGRSRRHREEAHPGRAARQGHLRAHARRAEGRSDDAGEPRGGARQPEERPRLPAQ